MLFGVASNDDVTDLVGKVGLQLLVDEQVTRTLMNEVHSKIACCVDGYESHIFVRN
jgi:hypothetical protein